MEKAFNFPPGSVSGYKFGLRIRMRENRTEKCMELVNIGVFVIKKEIKCSGDSEILHEIVRDMYYTTN